MSGNLKKRLAEYEQAPPGDAWENIAKKLDEANKLQSRLLHYEETPPPGLWKSIAEKMDDIDHATELISTNRKIKSWPILRYAAAAVIISFVSFSLIYLDKKSGNDIKNIDAAGSIKINDSNAAEAKNYISIKSENGDIVKVSSKFSNLVHYLDNNSTGDALATSTFWKEKIKGWKEKMISNTVIPTPENFMDIIELSEVVKDK